MAPPDKIILPDKYYLDNFEFLLGFVAKKYNTLLSIPEASFITQFQQLSEDAKCLYVRICNRKGIFFRLKKLQYNEINSIESAHIELLEQKFTTEKETLELDEIYQLMRVYNKSEIVKSLKTISSTIANTGSKEDLILQALEEIDTAHLIRLFYHSETIITQGQVEEFSMIKLFFFGNNHGNMADFVIRDVGHAKFMAIDETKLGRSFNTREEAEAVMMLSELHRDYLTLEETVDPIALHKWLGTLDINYFLGLEKSRRSAEKLIHKVGYHLERNKYYDQALNIYELSSASPMRERKIRVFNKLKEYEKSLEVAKEILLNPNDQKEYIIATDVLNKLNKKIKSTTTRQKEGVRIIIDAQYKNCVEEGALQYFKGQEYEGLHSENTIWSTFFGLIFWDEIFDPKYESMHQPLQRNPSDLYGNEFYKKRKPAITEKLSLIKNKEQIKFILEKSIKNYHGIANPFVIWDEALLNATFRLSSILTPIQSQAVLKEMSIDPKTRLTGFPDLFVWKKDDYSFYEVKSPNDHLSEKQLFWLQKFKTWEINAEIILVEWKST